MNAQGILSLAAGLSRSGRWAAMVLALAAAQSGCCCLECFEHCAAPIKIIPPKSALEPRNPPCSYVDPMCYGYHATCWRPWPAECHNARDCGEWYQHDAIPYPGKEPFAPPMAPLPPEPQAFAPSVLPQPPLNEPQHQTVSAESFESHVQPASDYAALPPIVSPGELPAALRLPGEGRSTVSSRRPTADRQLIELP